MSRAIALVKFNDGTILRGCYNGTSDILRSWLITDEQLQQDYDGSIFSCDDSDYETSLQLINIIDDEEVEIYSDYGRGSSWTGRASKSHKCVTDGRNIDYVETWTDEIPSWVIDYFKMKGWNFEHLQR